MCGIAGIVNLNPREPVDESRVKRMRDVLRHRGPDGEGLWAEGPVGLGHRRLAIVDVAGGHQPMANEDETVWITYNGEIYNHAELRPGLEARGHRYQTRSDTETILHLYEEEGDRCVERLRGMFAFALWDQRRGRLLLARDRLGIKPLYYAMTENELLFASEIKAILAAGSIRPALDEQILPEFLATRYVAGEDTFFKGVRALRPGRTLSWSRGGGLSERRYWQLPAVTDAGTGTFMERAVEVRSRLEAAVQSHLMSDVPLGLFLSGGIDSTGIAALMTPMVREPIRTFAVGFAEPEASELEYARLAARSVGAEHREVVARPEEFLQLLPRMIWHEDKPIAFSSSVALYFVSRLARDHVKVVLTGEGADELFLGYNWYRVTAWNERLGRAYAGLAPAAVRQQVRRLIPWLPRKARRYAERSFLIRPPGIRSLFHENFSAFPEATRSELFRNGALLALDPFAKHSAHYEESPCGTLARMSRADLQTYLVELLTKQDRMSMAASIESRVPFLDHELVEHVVTMPDRFKVRGWTTKAVLRKALEGRIPREILARRKMGFPVPIAAWLRGPWRPAMAEFVVSPRALDRGLFEPDGLRRLVREHETGAVNHGDRLWLLMNLEIWQRIFLDGQDVSAIAGGPNA
jgi:asparagine synthase (glutamine-hydrolysing)